MALEGTLSYLDVAHLFQVVGATRKTGVLEVATQGRWARLLFERGDLTCAQSNACHEGIGTLLVKAGLLTADDLERALGVQRAEGPGSRRLGAILCDQFGVEPDDIERLLRRQFERVVLDVFSWSSGRFVFRFAEPGEGAERFQLDAVEFILAVGIQAGFLADRALDLERAAPGRPRLVFVDADEARLTRYREHWQRKGYPISTCSDPAGAAEVLAGEAEGSRPILLVDWGLGGGSVVGPEALRLLLARAPGATAVALCAGGGAPERLAAREAGARAFVRRPVAEGPDGPGDRVSFEVFMVALESALALALSAPADEAP